MALVMQDVATKPKNSVINVRIDSDIKERSEKILEQMGFSMSGAIDSFLRQVIVEQRLPYQPATYSRIVSEDNLTKEELDGLLANAVGKITDDSGVLAEEFFKEISEEYGAKL